MGAARSVINLHASGGSGGIAHLLQHLGPSQREWARDLGKYPETDDYIQQIAEGVAEELEGRDFPEMLRACQRSLPKVREGSLAAQNGKPIVNQGLPKA